MGMGVHILGSIMKRKEQIQSNKYKVLSIREDRKRAATLRKEYSQLNLIQKLSILITKNLNVAWIWIKKNGKI